MDRWKGAYAQKSDKRKLADVIPGADIFLGLSAPRVLTQDMVKQMGNGPLVMALANPDPEIMPDEARAARPDAMICTGRSDYPNQVNNVLCFPFIFRGALDVGATTITEEMKMAAVRAIAELARAEQSEVVASAYGEKVSGFGPEYLIARPLLKATFPWQSAQTARCRGTGAGPSSRGKTRATISSVERWLPRGVVGFIGGPPAAPVACGRPGTGVT